jgi:hypothetical protein
MNPPVGDVHRLKVDEKAGILIATHIYGGLTVTHLFSGVLLWSLSKVRLLLYHYPHLARIPLA